MNKFVFRNSLILCLIFFILTIPQAVFAHALLEKATPAPDSQLKSPPNEIVLMFNERLEKELYSIKVFNENGEIVSSGKTEMSKDQKSIKQSLPTLPNGNYAITYSILSADGHPIKGSYVVTIGEDTVRNDMAEVDLENEENKSAFYSIFHSVVKIVYYFALLLTSGWIIWGTKDKIKLGELKSGFRKTSIYLQVFLLISTFVMGVIQLIGLLESWNVREVWDILSGTSFGVFWFISILLSVLGFFILHRFKWIDLLWAFMILSVKSINGHAMAFEPPIRTISIDIIHLVAAALWAGGLFYILIYWKKQKEHVKEFLPVFSKAALISILALIVTGVASTLIFLPKVQYLFVTQWGIMLLIKVALVLFVILVGSILRYIMKKKKEDVIRRLLIIDFSLMVVILVIVGIFTQLSPLPQNEPLEWHEKENYIEFTTAILPKAPGNNHFMVIASSHKEGVEIKQIELFLKYRDDPDFAPIQIPFSKIEQASNVQYMIDGKYIPFAGNWTAEIRILDSDDNEKVFRKDFTVY